MKADQCYKSFITEIYPSGPDKTEAITLYKQQFLPIMVREKNCNVEPGIDGSKSFGYKLDINTSRLRQDYFICDIK